MDLKDVLPIGSKYKMSKKELMSKAGIDEQTFTDEIRKIREDSILLFNDGGYYLPSSKTEYEEFIKKQESYLKAVENVIEMAKKEMEEM